MCVFGGGIFFIVHVGDVRTVNTGTRYELGNAFII